MILTRVIPILLLYERGLNKTVGFEPSHYLGDPFNIINIFNEKGVDELIFFDIGASRKGCGTDAAMLSRLAGECMSPLCFGGGLRSADDAKRVFDAGLEKVCFNSVLHKAPSVIEETARQFGSQSVSVSIDIRDTPKGREVWTECARRAVPADLLTVARQAVDVGAGEIVLQDIDRDGRRTGYNLEALRSLADAVHVPIVVGSGARNLADMRAALDAGASGVAAGSLFTLIGPLDAVLITYPSPDDLEQTLATLAQGTSGATTSPHS